MTSLRWQTCSVDLGGLFQPTQCQQMHIMSVFRVVIREDFSHTLVERLVNDIEKVLLELDHLPAKIQVVTNVAVFCDEKIGGNETSVKKTALETQKEITDAWKKFVMDRKKTTKVC
ncbi:hypothetical protein IFM89_025442 [Coptis chinensis]|uniref:Uncharacterized protein n=1 Tax=Coptis chinensis TaxID=261450 RepID=A0A835HY14_9MAGN|nr:hypothetical protein IFM89_025442 [Coptis chinensis]